jgi:uncharacterized protein (TIGR00304 family)
MNKLKLGALGLIVIGIVVLAVGALSGDGEFIILLFIPVYRGTGPYALGGGLLIFLGIVVGLIYLFKTYVPAPYQDTHGKSQAPGGKQGAPPMGGSKHGGVVFIGPVPIVWGSDAKTTLYTIIIGIIVVTTVLLAIFLYFVFNSL